MKRIVSSLRPFGAVSVSISVTKPYLYLSPTTARTVSAVSRGDAMLLFRACRQGCMGSLRLRRVLAAAGHHGIGQRERQFRQGYAAERLPNGIVDPPPPAPRRTERFHVAGAVALLDADRQGDRAINGADDVGRRHLRRRAGQPVAALGAAMRDEQPGAGEGSQELADSGRRQA